MAFKYAVYKINKDRTILPRTKVVYDIQYVPKDDSFHASKKGNLGPRAQRTHSLNRSIPFHSTVCDQLKAGVLAIFGPADPILGAHIYSICDALDIPYLDARIDSQAKPLVAQRWQADANSIDSGKFLGDPHLSTPPKQRPNARNVRREFTINLNPAQTLVNHAFQDVMRYLNWTTVAILYERNEG